MTTPLQHTSMGELGGYNPLLATSLGEIGSAVAEPPRRPSAGGGGGPGIGRWKRSVPVAEPLLTYDEIIAIVMAAMEYDE